jgi:hypothetical protein
LNAHAHSLQAHPENSVFDPLLCEASLYGTPRNFVRLDDKSCSFIALREILLQRLNIHQTEGIHKA